MAKISVVLKSVQELFEQNAGIIWTVRQVYYRLVSPPYQIFPNRRSSYVTFDKQLVTLRENGDIDDFKFVDTARRTEGGDTSNWGVKEYFNDTIEKVRNEADGFTKSLWKDQEYNIVVVLEKDALSRLVGDVTNRYRVALAVGRGYSSRTQILQIAQDHLIDDKKNAIVYLGDFDSSGLDIERSLDERLNDECSVDGLEMERIALTYEQALPLPPNPTKLSDTRASEYISQYGHDCWELDAIPPKDLQDIVEKGIKKYIDDPAAWSAARKAEKEGTERLDKMFNEMYDVLRKHYGEEGLDEDEEEDEDEDEDEGDD